MNQDDFITDIIHHTTTIWVNTLDKQGNIVLWNHAAEVISGYKKEEVEGKNDIWQKLYPDPEYREKVFAKAQLIINSHRKLYDFESAIISKFGTQVILSWNSHNLLDEKGEVVGSIAIARDITEKRNERLRLQNALRETQQSLTLSEERCEALRYGNTESIATLNHTLEQLENSQLNNEQQRLIHQAQQALSTLKETIDSESGH